MMVSKLESSRYQQELSRDYNFSILRVSSIVLTVTMALFSIVSAVSYLSGSVDAMSKQGRVYIYFFFFFFALAGFILFSRKTAEKYPLPFIYTLFVAIYILTVLINFSSPMMTPFSVTMCPIIALPMLVYDKAWRVNLINYICIIFCLIMSYWYKTPRIFHCDLFNSLVISAVGLILGGFSRDNQYKYLSIKEKEFRNELDVANAKTQAKSLFLTNISHEIRTPLNTILGLDEMILRECKDQDILKYAAELQESGGNLLSLINDLIDISRIEAGKMEILPVAYELRSLVNNLSNSIVMKAREKKLAFKIDVQPSIPSRLMGDEVRIRQCILNLLTNAVKYTNSGSVTLKIGYSVPKFEIEGESRIILHVSVSDTGIGIKDEDKERLFRIFERIDEKNNYSIEGAGLGLSITRELLGKMGSCIQFESEYGKGSRFFFDLPQKVISWYPCGLNTVSRFGEPEEKKLYKEKFHAPTASILAVDDTPMNLTVFCGLLKKTLVQIDTAGSGFDALKRIMQKHYDVIFIDYRMPDMDGEETLNAMKGYFRSNGIPVPPCIALTANAMSGSREHYLAAGFTDYLPKPVDGNKLEDMLIKYIDSSKVYPPGAELVTAGVDSGAEDEIDLEHIDGVDLAVAIEACGDKDLFMDVAAEFYASVDETADLIEKYEAEGNIKKFTIKVHALKGTARFIGAAKLSAMAAKLEKFGDEENAVEIHEQTPELLDFLRSYKQKLRQFAPKAEEMKKTENEGLTQTEYQDALTSILECANCQDFSSAMKVVEALGEEKLPAGKSSEDLEKVKAALKEGNLQYIQNLIESEKAAL